MDLEELARRIQAVEDLESVKQVTIKYVNCLMFADWDHIMECFADDAVLDVFVERPAVQGKDIIEKTFREVVSSKHVGNEGDILTHPLIKVDGNAATGQWIIYFFDGPSENYRPPGWVKGIYTAEYKKINGEWKFGMLKWRPVFPPGMKMPAGPPPPDR